jgi:hypothetical protein
MKVETTKISAIEINLGRMSTENAKAISLSTTCRRNSSMANFMALAVFMLWITWLSVTGKCFPRLDFLTTLYKNCNNNEKYNLSVA